jgi:predicted metal-dependent hydrolase
MSTAAAPRAPVPPRDITTRRIAFDYPAEALPRHFVGGDLVMSHIVAVLSAMFPNGEDFFVQSVRNYRDRVEDPELRKQVGKFIGQEAIHGREHRELNDRLQEMGFGTRLVDRAVGLVVKRLGARMLPKVSQLAVTAALEHYTATLAEVLMSSEDARQMLDVDEVRHLLLWHALEESEHKSVAFDVFQAVCGNDRLRIRVMRVVTAAFLVALVAGTAWSMARDPATYNPRKLVGSIRRLRRSPFLSRAVVARIGDYNRPGFHPDDHDATALLERWRAELFGSEGLLVDHLERGRA